MLDAMELGPLFLKDRLGLLLAMTYPGALPRRSPPWLDIHPPHLVRQNVNEIRAKTVFHEILDPINRSDLGKVFDKLVPI